MIKTYERTMFIENLADAKVKLYVYENSKYTGNASTLVTLVKKRKSTIQDSSLGALLMVMMQQLLKLKLMEVVLMKITSTWY